MKKTRNLVSLLLSLTVLLSMISFAQVTASAASDVVERAISWAVAIANDNSHGYSQQSRWGPDYDCSSLVIAAFKYAGVDTGTQLRISGKGSSGINGGPNGDIYIEFNVCNLVI